MCPATSCQSGRPVAPASTSRERAARASVSPVSATPTRPMHSTPVWGISLKAPLSAEGR